MFLKIRSKKNEFAEKFDSLIVIKMNNKCKFDDITLGLIIKTNSNHVDDIIRFFKADSDSFIVYFKSSRKKLILTEAEGV
jgi:hypothetical protein